MSMTSRLEAVFDRSNRSEAKEHARGPADRAHCSLQATCALRIQVRIPRWGAETSARGLVNGDGEVAFPRFEVSPINSRHCPTESCLEWPARARWAARPAIGWAGASP